MIFLLCLTFILLLYFYIHWSEKSRLIDKIFPGPRRLPFIGNLTLEMLTPDGLYQYFQNLIEVYNFRPFRFWCLHRPYVLITDSKTAKIILSQIKHTDKADAYESLVPWIGRNHFVGSGEVWQRYRKFASYVFDYNKLGNYIQHFEKYSKILCQKLANHDGGKAFDVHEYMSLFALDVLAESFMGVDLKSQTEKTNARYADAVKNMIRISMTRSMFPILQTNWIFYLTPWGRMEKKSIQTLRDFSRELIRSRRENQKQNLNAQSNADDNELMADRFLNYLFENKFTDEEIQMEIESFFLGGLDNIRSSLCFSLYHLAEHQEIQEKVYQELNSIFGDSDDCPTHDQLNNMKYTEQVIKETLRLFPSSPALARHIKEDVQINEHQFIPKDTNVVIIMAAIHRDPTQWDNPDVFDPERFSEEKSKSIDYYSFVPFSAGPRNCSGHKYAMLELKVAIAHIIRKFKILPSGRVEDEIRVAVDFMLTSTNGFHLKLQSRNAIKM